MLRKGFTLIELLVVITILAVLAGAALPYVQNYVEEARIAKAKTDLEEVSRAIAVYETREGTYLKTDVSDLTGRYLNKAPIDPWGKPYFVATASGLIVSGGPDRDTATVDDNIQVPYQPPLALVSVKWVDKNQSGAVDTQNVPDQIKLIFSRRVGNAIGDFSDAGAGINALFNVKVDGVGTPMNTIVDETAANVTFIASRTLIYDVLGNDVFTAGRDTINIVSGHNTIVDGASSFALSDQDVKMLPQ